MRYGAIGAKAHGLVWAFRIGMHLQRWLDHVRARDARVALGGYLPASVSRALLAPFSPPLPSLSTICSIFNRRDLICSSMLGFAKRHWHSIEAAGSLAKTAKFALLHE